MIADLIAVLLETALASSAATLLVLLLRRPMRRLVGARAAYALWLLLPVSAGAVLLPARTLIVDESTIGRAGEVALALPSIESMQAPIDREPWLLLLWVAGAIGMAMLLGAQQRRFLRGLGRLRARDDDGWQAESVDAGPAVVGLWQGRIVLPADFDSRYTESERDLVLRHERAHLARRDPLANVIASTLRCVYWFNPLLHYAVGRFRFDQELAVDATVLAQRPDARRCYADAMLKTQLMLDPPPLGCHWQSAHPLKERITMLKHPLPGAARIAAGVAFAFLLSASTGYVAWASQPATQEVSQDDATTSGPSEVRENLDGRRHNPPRYPKDAIERRVSGTVILVVDVGADGIPLKTELSRERSSPDIDGSLVASAQEAVMKWQFEPARDEQGNGKPGRVLVPITFDVNGDPAPTPVPNPLPKPAPREVSAQAAPGPVPTYNAVKPPRYPIAAIKERRSGQVLLRVLVGSDGMLQQVEVETTSGSPDLDEAAIAAVRGWTFNPAHDGYKHVPAWIGIPVNFALNDDEVSMRASASRIELSGRGDSVSMSGDVVLDQGGQRVRGARAIYDIDSGQRVVVGGEDATPATSPAERDATLASPLEG